MLIVALVLAVIGLAALVTAVVTSNELVAWVCIAASVIGVILLIVDAIRERQNRRGAEAESVTAAVTTETTESSATAETTAYSETDETVDSTYSTFDADYPDDPTSEVPVDDEPAADEPADESEEKPSGESGSR
jgi:ABC-type bacteriocin/lantibiotic exporter with double-glycine peptidase domain